MRIKATATKSTSEQLADILKDTFPQAINTGLSNDLCSIKTDPKSKGKSVFFMYKKTTFRMTENLKVTERDFTNTFTETAVAKEIEAMIKSRICSGVAVEAEKTPAPQPVAEPAPAEAEVPAGWDKVTA